MYIAPQTREGDAISIDAAMAMRGEFAHESSAVLTPFDALVELLTGGECAARLRWLARGNTPKVQFHR